MNTPKPIRQKTPGLCFHRGRSLWYVRLNESVHYLGSDPAEAKKRYRLTIAEWMGRGCQAPPPKPDDLRIVELCARYMGHCREYYAQSPGNVDRVKGAMAPLLELYADMPAQDFTPTSLKTLRLGMIGRGWTRVFINRSVQVINRMFRWAVAEMMLPPEVHQRLAALEGLRKGFTTAPEGMHRQPMTDSELESVRPYLPGPVMAALEIMFLAGARPSEILNLHPCDIERNGDVWRVVLADHKTSHLGKDRVLHFGPRAQRILTPFLLRPAESFLFSPRESFQESMDKRHAARVTALSCGNTIGSNRVMMPKRQPGDHYNHKAFRRCIARAVAQVNVQRRKDKVPELRNFCPYEARHGCATRIREAASLDAVQAVLGHAKIDMSAHYAKLNDELSAEIMRRMG